jgi:hypothetical protein
MQGIRLQAERTRPKSYNCFNPITNRLSSRVISKTLRTSERLSSTTDATQLSINFSGIKFSLKMPETFANWLILALVTASKKISRLLEIIFNKDALSCLILW